MSKMLSSRPLPQHWIINLWAHGGEKEEDESKFQYCPGTNYIRPPPPFHPFLARRHLPGRRGGGVYFEAPRGRNFIRPPTPRRVFSGVEGGGVQNSAS